MNDTSTDELYEILIKFNQDIDENSRNRRNSLRALARTQHAIQAWSDKRVAEALKKLPVEQVVVEIDTGFHEVDVVYKASIDLALKKEDRKHD